MCIVSQSKDSFFQRKGENVSRMQISRYEESGTARCGDHQQAFREVFDDLPISDQVFFER